MKSKILWCLFLISLDTVTVLSSSIGCNFIDNSMKSIELVCKNLKDSVPRQSSCYSSLFQDDSTGVNKLRVTSLNFGACKGFGSVALNSKSYNWFRNLQTFDISSVGIDDLSSAILNIPQIEFFKATRNNFEIFPKLPFEKMPKLKEIDFSNNDIALIPRRSFNRAESLTAINLSQNSLSLFDHDTFSTLMNLEILDLGENFIETIDKDLFRNNAKLSILNLNGNPILCLSQAMLKRWPGLNATAECDDSKNTKGKGIFACFMSKFMSHF